MSAWFGTSKLHGFIMAKKKRYHKQSISASKTPSVNNIEKHNLDEVVAQNFEFTEEAKAFTKAKSKLVSLVNRRVQDIRSKDHFEAPPTSTFDNEERIETHIDKGKQEPKTMST